MQGKILLDWLAQEGDLVRRGEPLYMVETRKRVFEVPSDLGEGIERLLLAKGASAAAGQTIALIASPNEVGEGTVPE